MKRPLLAVLIAFATAGAAAADEWNSSLTPAPGPTALPRPFEAEYRFGWSDIEAARATAKVTFSGSEGRLQGQGATNGLARMLWQLDVTHEATTRLPDFEIVETRQIERYAQRTLDIHMVTKPDGLWRLRDSGSQPPAKWKKIKVSPLRDLFSGMLFIRSQKLSPGDTVTTVIYPGDSPFLVTLKVLGNEPLVLAGAARDAIKLDITIQKINTKNDNKLEPHSKFRSGKVWLSNDADRLPLRAEVDIFIGYVFAELESVRFDPPAR